MIDSVFTREWLGEHDGATFYSYSPDERRWTFVHASGSPTTWTTAAVSKELLHVLSDDEGSAESEDSFPVFSLL